MEKEIDINSTKSIYLFALHYVIYASNYKLILNEKFIENYSRQDNNRYFTD